MARVHLKSICLAYGLSCTIVLPRIGLAASVEDSGMRYAQGVISNATLVPASSYCHLRFPMIREDTLYSDHPVLKDDGAFIDYYGPCDHDPGLMPCLISVTSGNAPANVEQCHQW